MGAYEDLPRACKQDPQGASRKPHAQRSAKSLKNLAPIRPPGLSRNHSFSGFAGHCPASPAPGAELPEGPRHIPRQARSRPMTRRVARSLRSRHVLVGSLSIPAKPHSPLDGLVTHLMAVAGRAPLSLASGPASRLRTVPWRSPGRFVGEQTAASSRVQPGDARRLPRHLGQLPWPTPYGRLMVRTAGRGPGPGFQADGIGSARARTAMLRPCRVGGRRPMAAKAAGAKVEN